MYKLKPISEMVESLVGKWLGDLVKCLRTPGSVSCQEKRRASPVSEMWLILGLVSSSCIFGIKRKILWKILSQANRKSTLNT